MAVLAGVIASSTLKEEFHPSIYNGQASSCIVDSRDGNYVMDEWHDELGNAYTTPDRTKLKAYENISLKEEVKAQRTGVIAFESKTTGKPLYMYYMPLQLFDWELLVFVQEDVAFANLIYLKHLLIFAGIVEALFLAIYFVWNLRQVRQLMKQQEQLQFMSYCDGLTSLYNRNKYIELIESCKNEKRENVGVAYLDLNGLKEINDQKGHANGDRLICAAADILHQVCPGSVYRIGGDEFVIISFGVEEEIFEKQIQMIREQMWTQQISISLGALWRASCDGLERLLKEADVRMYAEKQQYYQMCEQQADGDAGYAEK